MAATEESQKPAIAATLRGPGPAKYRLPGTVGFLYHDPTRKRDPAFSFGSRFAVKVTQHLVFAQEQKWASLYQMCQKINVVEKWELLILSLS